MTTYPQPHDLANLMSRADGTTESHEVDHGRVIGVWENIKHHGAKGAGNSSYAAANTAAFQAAVTATGWPTTRGTVVLPQDHYVLDGTGIVLNGGGGTSTPELTIIGNGSRLSSTTASTSPLIDVTNSIVSTTYITLDGITFLANASGAPYRTAVRLTNTEATCITNCAFAGNFGLGIDVASTSNYNRITNCSFFSMSRGISFSGTGTFTTISNNIFGEGLGGNPLNWIDASTGAFPTDNITVVGNIFYGSGATLGVLRVTAGSGWTISGNQFFLSEVESIRLGTNGSSSAHSITGNTFRQGKQHDIYIDGAQRNTISGNSFMERGAGVTANTYNAITVKNTFGADAGHHNAIIGNVSTDTANALDQFIKLDAGSDYCTIVGNIGAAGITAAGANNQTANNVTH